MPVLALGLGSRTAAASTVVVGLAVDLVAGVAVGSRTGVSIPTGVGEGSAGGSSVGDIATVTLDSPGTWVPAGGPACSPPQAASARRPAAKLDKIKTFPSTPEKTPRSLTAPFASDARLPLVDPFSPKSREPPCCGTKYWSHSPTRIDLSKGGGRPYHWAIFAKWPREMSAGLHCVVGSSGESTGPRSGACLAPVLIPAPRNLCESEYPGRVVHSYRSNRIFRKILASHSGNDVLENVAVAVPAISDKPVFRADVLANHNSCRNSPRRRCAL